MLIDITSQSPEVGQEIVSLSYGGMVTSGKVIVEGNIMWCKSTDGCHMIRMWYPYNEFLSVVVTSGYEDLHMVTENMTDFMVDFPNDYHGLPPKSQFDLQFGLLQEELDELKEAYDNDDVIECRDALADLRYVLNAMIKKLGIGKTHVSDFREVHRSNQSKLCADVDEAQATVNAYRKGVHPDKPGIQINCNYKKNRNGKYVVYRVSDGKYMKSLSYQKPDIKTV
jgi:hypothetical protein